MNAVFFKACGRDNLSVGPANLGSLELSEKELGVTHARSSCS